MVGKGGKSDFGASADRTGEYFLGLMRWVGGGGVFLTLFVMVPVGIRMGGLFEVVIGVVSESDFVKISEQLSPPGSRGTASFLAPRFRACVLMS